MEQILLIIGLACLTHLWIVSEPTIVLREALGIGTADYGKRGKYVQAIIRLITCHQCLGFWFGFAVLQNLWLAAIVAVLASIISKITLPRL